VAASLGAGWFIVLLVPPVTREWLLDDRVQNLSLLVIASVLTALIGRKYIKSAQSFGSHFVRAAVLPYCGCILFLSLIAGHMWLRTLLFGGLANLHDTLSLYTMGLTAALVSFYVVIPYGLVCQYTMKWASD
jgi:hypothetical protein